MIKKILTLGILIGLFLHASVMAQEPGYRNNPLYLNSYRLRPVLLQKGKYLVQVSANIPHFYKWYSPKTGKYERLTSYQVINEAYFSGILTYGISNRLNLFMVIPVNDLHHYSPMGINKGIGLGDIKAGINWNLLAGHQDANNKYTAGITLGFPTGKHYNLKPGRLPTGTGSVSLRGDITGFHKSSNFNLLYSVYFAYLTNHNIYKTGNEGGGYLILQKPFNTSVGQFGIETSAYTYYKSATKKSGVTIPNTKDYGIDLGIGGWFNYQKNLSIRFNVPYSVYQNSSWLTKYQVMLEIDYLF